MTKLVVGCPVRDRAWILPTWFDHIERSCVVADIEPVYAFSVGTSTDDTSGVISDRAPEAAVVYTNEPPVPESTRRWVPERFAEMVGARNALLAVVRELQPDFFFSVDSDMLLAENALAFLLETYRSHQWSAVGGKAYMMSSGTHTPSYAFNKPAGGLAREESDGVFEVQILMAIKLMDANAFMTDYMFSDKGEDVGWSLACARRGLRLGWDGRIVNKHVMLRRQLHEPDPRVGF